jgi:NCS1 family nucleobase:cation symporter-1
MEDASKYIGWLVAYSGGLGSIAGVLIADYWLVRRRRLRLEDLYLTHGVYRYAGGWNWKAVAATVVGCFLALGGHVVPPLQPLLPYGWFVGFFASGLLYWALSASRQPESVAEAAGVSGA